MGGNFMSHWIVDTKLWGRTRPFAWSIAIWTASYIQSIAFNAIIRSM